MTNPNQKMNDMIRQKAGYVTEQPEQPMTGHGSSDGAAGSGSRPKGTMNQIIRSEVARLRSLRIRPGGR